MKIFFSAIFAFFLCIPSQLRAVELPYRTYSLYGGKVTVHIPTFIKKTKSALGYSFLLPSSSGFVPNVNIQRQNFFGSIRAYAAISKQQFRALNIHLIKSSFPHKTVWYVEYTGKIGRKLSFAALAYKTSSGIILITATATPSQWKVSSVNNGLNSIIDGITIYR